MTSPPLLCPFSLFHLLQLTKSLCQAICQPHITPLSYITYCIWLPNLLWTTLWISKLPTGSIFKEGHSAALVSDQLIHLNLLSISVSVYPSRGAKLCKVMCFSLRMNRMWSSFVSSGSPASNLLLFSHFPTITEAYKLPWGTMLDPLMFPAYQDAFT